MTVRGAVLAVGGGVLLLLGHRLGWPELSALGGGALGLTVLALLLAGRRPRVRVELASVPRSAVRGAEAHAHLQVLADRGARGLRLVVAAPDRTDASVALPRLRAGEPLAVPVAVHTAERGVRPVGPWSLVREDPWGLVRREVARLDGAPVTVHPRTAVVARRLPAGPRAGDGELGSRRPGDEHVSALREYVLGDEPRAVHWRCSARAGHLVVREHVAAASDVVVVLLDVDSGAYATGSAFATSFSRERFEEAVDVAASLAVAQRGGARSVHLSTTARAARPASGGAASGAPALDALALVRPLAPVDAAPEQAAAALRRLRCARVLAVSGDPDGRLLGALRALGRDVPVLLVRVGGAGSAPARGVHTLHLAGADDLSSAG